MQQDKVIWFAIVFSTFVYAMIAWMLHPNPAGTFEEAARRQTTLIFYGLALASFVMGFVLPGAMRVPARLKMILSLAIFESCAIFGLMAAFIARDWRLFIPAWIVALLGMWRVYPSSDAV